MRLYLSDEEMDRIAKEAYEEWRRESSEPDPHAIGPRSLIELHHFAEGGLDRESANPPLTKEEIAYLDGLDAETREYRERGIEISWEIPFD